ncbi:MAG: amino acid ABC transporter substrate-binding protein [Proteobacteria bacterium]|nr:amino acid ABC transporter substrate-binding protein [Pseudomonadota bacterium]
MAQSQTVDAIKKRGHLLCSGVTANYAGFDVVQPNGEEVGFDVDICRAVATSILGDRTKFKTVPMNYLQRFTALQSGNIDLIAKNTTWTLSRNTEIGVMFTSPYLFTGDAFMVRKDSGIKKGVDLAGGTVCMSAGTTLEQLVSDFFTGHKLQYKPIAYENTTERDKAFFAGRCDASAGFIPGLAGSRAQSGKPDDYIILDDVFGKEIISAGVRPDDVKYYNIVNWTIFALLEAEELGITQANVDSMRNEQSTPAVKRLLGVIPGVGKRLGLRETWAYEVIKQNGNYAEIYERNIGSKSPLKMDRGYSRLWKDGGTLYSPSVD